MSPVIFLDKATTANSIISSRYEFSYIVLIRQTLHPECVIIEEFPSLESTAKTAIAFGVNV